MSKPIDSFTGQNRFLSNFFPAIFFWCGWWWSSTEHAYQAMKAEDMDDFKAILHCDTPGQAKRMGKNVRMREDWEEIKLGVMRAVVTEKFTQNHHLMMLLQNTEDAELIEGNTWGDTYWGVCRGVGENNLGKILMEIRNANPPIL